MIYKSKQDLERVISLKKPQRVIETFYESYQHGVQYQAWLDEQQAKYDALTITEDQVSTDEDGNETTTTVVISEPELSFDEWLQEREVITEEVTTTSFDEEGNEVTTTETVEREGELLRQFVVGEIPPFAESEFYRSFIKNVGLEYNGIIVPISKDTQDTTTALAVAFQSGLTETVFHFENGSKLELNAESFGDFAAWFMTERGKLFGA